MRRAELEEHEVERLADLAHDAGVSLRVTVDLNGEASFTATGFGTFTDLVSLERALGDAMRVTT